MVTVLSNLYHVRPGDFGDVGAEQIFAAINEGMMLSSSVQLTFRNRAQYQMTAISPASPG